MRSTSSNFPTQMAQESALGASGHLACIPSLPGRGCQQLLVPSVHPNHSLLPVSASRPPHAGLPLKIYGSAEERRTTGPLKNKRDPNLSRCKPSCTTAFSSKRMEKATPFSCLGLRGSSRPAERGVQKGQSQQPLCHRAGGCGIPLPSFRPTPKKPSRAQKCQLILSLCITGKPPGHAERPSTRGRMLDR